jgi:hypothetical protein
VFLCIKTNAQKKYNAYFGVIYNAKNTVSDVHIINLNSKVGTISNSIGTFEISAAIGDVLLFSSIEYEPLKIKITEAYAPSKELIIILKPNIYKLDEVFLNGLTGNLSYDLANQPKDTIPKHTFVFDRNQVRKLGEDYAINFLKPPNAEALTNPILLNGVGASVTIPDNRIKAEKKLKKELKQKLYFPIKLKKELGVAFFVENLKIPEDKIYNFINYCETKKIIQKYYDNKVLEVIKILQEESKLYNEIK